MHKLLLVVLLVAACGPKRKNQCPGNTTGHCALGEKCTFDKVRGCQACVCESIDGDTQNPRDPGDPTAPPTLER